MVTPSKPIHGTKSWINSETFLENLHLTQKGRQILYNKGIELKKRYHLLKDINHREIYAESCDLNYTIQATNAFLMGIYNPFNKADKLPF
jgi:lysophospholipase L1-like esterase